jgi:hypothetical protein
MAEEFTPKATQIFEHFTVLVRLPEHIFISAQGSEYDVENNNVKILVIFY